MKKLLWVLLILLNVIVAYSQDSIIKYNGEKIAVKVTAISPM